MEEKAKVVMSFNLRFSLNLQMLHEFRYVCVSCYACIHKSVGRALNKFV